MKKIELGEIIKLLVIVVLVYILMKFGQEILGGILGILGISGLKGFGKSGTNDSIEHEKKINALNNEIEELEKKLEEKERDYLEKIKVIQDSGNKVKDVDSKIAVLEDSIKQGESKLSKMSMEELLDYVKKNKLY